MSEHKATIHWQRHDADFLSGKFSRDHTWSFDGGASIAASANPEIVRPPLTSPAAVDPEEALVASISSCHMLTFLYLAAKRGFQIDSYTDSAVGTMTKNEKGIPWVSAARLRPEIVFGGDQRPTQEEVAELHHQAHKLCFIANSVKADITVEAD
ncbi:MAG: OsmC family protein [Pirellulales bacterium]|nr:OsmC family protein [Pirellulales bacterium]